MPHHSPASRLALTLTIAAGCLVAAAAPAHAAGCVAAYDAAGHVLTIDGCTADPDASVTATISRTVAGAIQLDGQAIAGGPTVTNTDEISYSGADGASDEITIDMTDGEFAPGHTPEIVSKNEIELTIDGGTGGINFLTLLGDDARSDAIGVGASGIDFTDDGDSDISRANLTGRLVVDGQGGDDSLAGMIAGASRSSAPLELRGGSGDDDLRGGLSNDALEGGPGFDSITDSRAGGFTLGQAILTGHGTDTLESIESATLTGDAGPDTIDASAFDGTVTLGGFGGNDTLRGGAGDDALHGYEDDDVLDGGPGTDAVHGFFAGDAALTDGAMSGAGSDSLASIERATLYGSDAGETLDASGFSGDVTMLAGGGLDTLLGGPGHDRLYGGDGADELRGGLGSDVLDAGAGDDRTFSDDGVSEEVQCGAGADAALADTVDGLQGCEQIDRGGAASQPDPVGDPGGSAQPGQPGGPGSPSEPAPPVVEPAPPAVATPDAVAPSLSRLSLARRTFRAAPRGAALASASVGTAVRFTLSERAGVTLRIRRAAPGRRAGGACRAPDAGNRSKPPCTRYMRLRGSLTYSGVAGANRVLLRGRLGRRALPPGRYRLVARAGDAAGNRSAARRAEFRIVNG